MSTSNQIMGFATFATLRVWMEDEFRYVDIVEHAPGDRRADYHALHQPPLIIVTSIRLDPHPPVHPHRVTTVRMEDAR